MAAGAVGAGLEIFNKLLDEFSGNVIDNEDFFAIWNDWQGRDGRARIERTFGHGRWSYEKKTFGIPNGRWYCCLKQGAAKRKGIPLD